MVEIHFILNPEENQPCAGDSQSQTEYIQKAVAFIFVQVSPGGLKEVFQHIYQV
jgi:hypothetical protein